MRAGLISSVNYERSISVKKPNSTEGTLRRKKKEKKDEDRT